MEPEPATAEPAGAGMFIARLALPLPNLSTLLSVA